MKRRRKKPDKWSSGASKGNKEMSKRRSNRLWPGRKNKYECVCGRNKSSLVLVSWLQSAMTSQMEEEEENNKKWPLKTRPRKTWQKMFTSDKSHSQDWLNWSACMPSCPSVDSFISKEQQREKRTNAPQKLLHLGGGRACGLSRNVVSRVWTRGLLGWRKKQNFQSWRRQTVASTTLKHRLTRENKLLTVKKMPAE